jgi:hypothetical protein
MEQPGGRIIVISGQTSAGAYGYRMMHKAGSQYASGTTGDKGTTEAFAANCYGDSNETRAKRQKRTRLRYWAAKPVLCSGRRGQLDIDHWVPETVSHSQGGNSQTKIGKRRAAAGDDVHDACRTLEGCYMVASRTGGDNS